MTGSTVTGAATDTGVTAGFTTGVTTGVTVTGATVGVPTREIKVNGQIYSTE